MRRAVLMLLGVTALAACAIAPRRIENPPAGALPPEQRIEIWQGGKHAMVRHLEVDGDSLRAVPMPEPFDCDSCRVRYAISDVDSLRYPRNDHAAAVATAVPIAILSAVTVIWGMSGT